MTSLSFFESQLLCLFIAAHLLINNVSHLHICVCYACSAFKQSSEQLFCGESERRKTTQHQFNLAVSQSDNFIISSFHSIFVFKCTVRLNWDDVFLVVSTKCIKIASAYSLQTMEKQCKQCRPVEGKKKAIISSNPPFHCFLSLSVKKWCSKLLLLHFVSALLLRSLYVTIHIDKYLCRQALTWKWLPKEELSLYCHQVKRTIKRSSAVRQGCKLLASWNRQCYAAIMLRVMQYFRSGLTNCRLACVVCLAFAMHSDRQVEEIMWQRVKLHVANDMMLIHVAC